MVSPIHFLAVEDIDKLDRAIDHGVIGPERLKSLNLTLATRKQITSRIEEEMNSPSAILRALYRFVRGVF